MFHNKHIYLLLFWAAVSTFLFILLPTVAFLRAPGLTHDTIHHVTDAWSKITHATAPEEPLSEAEVVSEEPTAREEYVALVMIVKDQGPDMAEFLQHHHQNMGINRFYIYDDGSEPPLSTMVSTFGVPEDILTIEYHPWRKDSAKQRKFYNGAAARWGPLHTWLGFLDPDEFLDTPGPESLHSILRGLEPMARIGALAVNWQLHTSNGQLTRASSVRGTYTTCIADEFRGVPGVSDNREYKSFVRSSAYGQAVNAHHIELRNKMITVGENGDTVGHRLFRDPISRARIGVHHYIMKSREEYEQKMLRGGGSARHRDWENWRQMEEVAPHVNCTEITRWL